VKTVVELNHLDKNYGSLQAVKDVSFDVIDGEIFGLLGPNGAGKTTTVECLQGLRHYDGGTARVLGFDPNSESSALRRQIGSQLQQSALPDRLRVWEALDLFASLSPVKADLKELMQQWGLTEKRNASFSNLSGGQRQRLFVALSLVNRPKLVFLDEMTTGLDPAARHVAWDLIKAIRKGGATVVLVTHFMEEAEALCDRLAIFDQGQVVALDTPRGLINSYAGEVKVIFTTDIADLSWLGAIDCVTAVDRNGPRVTVSGRGAVLALVAASLVEHGIVPADLHLEEPSLEDVFLKITGHVAHD
jgi:ABC-2 type transport system ATP-binding protein